MLIEHKKESLRWGALDLGLFGLNKDWYGEQVDPPAGFGMAMDKQKFWFVATRRSPANIHPQARPGQFTPELWKYDCAEFFLSHAPSGRYLEFNLAPNGAWWTAEFTAPRIKIQEEDLPVPGVECYAELSTDGSWLAAASIPLEVLRARFDFGKQTKMNATFIVNSPEQKFLTAIPPAEGEPDFHRPDLFQQVKIVDGGLTFDQQGPDSNS